MRLGLGVRCKRKKLSCITAVVCIAAVICIVLKRIEPAYDLHVKGYANSAVNTIVNESISEVLANNNYSNFVSMGYNDSNKISALETDTIKINKLKSELLLNIQKKIDAYDAQIIYIPLLSASDFHIFSGMGPKLPVNISPVSIINSSLDECFDDAGINQVRHRLILKISANVLCSGFMYSKQETTDIEIPIFETVISGDTPEYYGGNISVMGR